MAGLHGDWKPVFLIAYLLPWVCGLVGKGCKELKLPQLQTEEKGFQKKLFSMVRKNNFFALPTSGQDGRFRV